MKRYNSRAWVWGLVGVFGVAMGFLVATSAKASGNLAQDAQNPVADLISVPFENYFNFSDGPFDQLQYTLSVKPVLPFHLSKNWNLISRTIMPFVEQPSVTNKNESTLALGDMNPSFFLTPVNAGEFT